MLALLCVSQLWCCFFPCSLGHFLHSFYITLQWFNMFRSASTHTHVRTQTNTHTHNDEWWLAILEGWHVNTSTVNYNFVGVRARVSPTFMHTHTHAGLWKCFFRVKGRSRCVEDSLSLSLSLCFHLIAAESGVNFCSTCGSTVYPLTHPTLSWTDLILMIC